MAVENLSHLPRTLPRLGDMWASANPKKAREDLQRSRVALKEVFRKFASGEEVPFSELKSSLPAQDIMNMDDKVSFPRI
jgi:hypothetical protein